MKYVIQLITKDAPYILLGYYGGNGKIVRNLATAEKIEDRNEVKEACRRIRVDYNGKKNVYATPWVYDVTSEGKLGVRRFELEK